jgi:hypothetical protein
MTRINQLPKNQLLKNLLKSSPLKRVTRVAAFALGAGIAFLGAGSLQGLQPLESAQFGATGAVLGLLMAILFTYAGKGQVPDEDFDNSINSAIETVNSKTKKSDK